MKKITIKDIEETFENANLSDIYFKALNDALVYFNYTSAMPDELLNGTKKQKEELKEFTHESLKPNQIIGIIYYIKNMLSEDFQYKRFKDIEDYYIKCAKEMEKEKPKCALIGKDGNIFNLMGIASRTLRNNNMKEEAKEMVIRIEESKNYDEALCIISDYVEIVGEEDIEEEYE